MVEHPKAPEGQVADAPKNNWVDAYAPEWSRPYLRLSRADRPIGTWLLFFPCVWGILLAAVYYGNPTVWDIWLILGCGAGAFLMRGAGCCWNDITDRKIDAKVARTRSRPIPSGQASVAQAVIWMGAQALLAFCILISFGWMATWVGVASLAVVAVYPFAKRFTWWPQAFLGLAFNWGALLGWVAHAGRLDWAAVLLYLAGIAWTLFYDTIYAHQDADDDALIGVKSTARLFGDNSPLWLRWFMVASVALLLAAVAISAPAGAAAQLVLMGAPIGFGLHLLWQLRQLDINNTHKCLALFHSNRNAGVIPALFFAIVVFL